MMTPEVFNIFALLPEDRAEFLAALTDPRGFDQPALNWRWNGDVIIYTEEN